MYLPKHFAEDRLDVLAAFVAEHPLATLVTQAGAELLATLNQNRPPADVDGTIDGLAGRGDPSAAALADTMRSRRR
jgi:predicted FMN-binding regulatory protein PaiB